MRGLFLNFCLLFTDNSPGIFHATSYLSFLLLAIICVKPKIRSHQMQIDGPPIWLKLIIHVKQYLLKVWLFRSWASSTGSGGGREAMDQLSCGNAWVGSTHDCLLCSRIAGTLVSALLHLRKGWALLSISWYDFQKGDGFTPAASAQLAHAVLTNVYLFKFFRWETGYFNTLDITLDRAGFMLCWGCLCYVQVTISTPHALIRKQTISTGFRYTLEFYL